MRLFVGCAALSLMAIATHLATTSAQPKTVEKIEADKKLKWLKRFEVKAAATKGRIILFSKGKLTDKILAEDRKIVLAAVEVHFPSWHAKGWTKDDVCDAVLHVWETLRIGPKPATADSPIDKQAVVASADRLGAVKIITKPDGATVHVDGSRHKQPTTTTVFEEREKEVNLTISLDGYATEERKVAIVRGKLKKLELTLKSQR